MKNGLDRRASSARFADSCFRLIFHSGSILAGFGELSYSTLIFKSLFVEPPVEIDVKFAESKYFLSAT